MADKALSLPPVATGSNNLITVLNDNDVLLGRGTGPSQFIGNKRFRAHAAMCSKRYISALRNSEKRRIAAELLNSIHLLGGRFLKKVKQVIPGDDFADNAVYCEADEAVALEKCKQTLRDQVENAKQRPNDETNVSILGPSEGSLNVDSYIGTAPVAMDKRRIDEMKLLLTRILMQQNQQDRALNDPTLASSSGSMVRVAPLDSLDLSSISHSSLSTMKTKNGGNTDDDDEEDPKPQSGGIRESFPQKLYRMLEDAEENGQEDVLSFSPNGRAFAIHKPRKFVEDILPRYLNTTRVSSFHRQLSLYGFHRVTEGHNMGYHYHKYFLKGQKELVNKITRKRPVRPNPATVDLEESIGAYRREMSGSGVGLGIPAVNFTTHHLSRPQQLLAQSQMINGGDPWPLGLGHNLSRLPPAVMDVWDPSVQVGDAATRSHLFAAGNGLRNDPTIAILLEEHQRSEFRIAQLQQRRQQISDLFHFIS